MKDYIKPTFILAGLAPVALAGTNCGIDEGGKALLEDMHGSDWTKLFRSDPEDGCTIIEDDTIYCKYTAYSMNATTVIGS